MNTAVTLVVAGEPDQPTGGYRYDARIVAGLRERGYPVAVVGLAGRFPDADDAARSSLATALRRLPDGALVVVDALAIAALPGVAEHHAERLRMVALVHHPLGDETGLPAATRARLSALEARALARVRAAIVTSRFTADRLRELGIAPRLTRVVEPGVAPAENAAGGSGPGFALLCVATLIPRKGHDVLIEALAQHADAPWTCEWVGAADRDPAWAAELRSRIAAHGLGARIICRGALDEAGLAAAYHRADLFVLASHYEGYGMAVTEALARGLPVIATRGGALATTLPAAAGLGVEPGDASELARALGRFMTDGACRARLTAGAARARAALAGWPAAVDAFVTALNVVGARSGA